MKVLIALFLVTIVAHGVISDLKCWGCWSVENNDKTHLCNDRNNFEVIKCEKKENMCIDLVYKEEKYMAKQCLSEEYWKDLKPYVENPNNGVYYKICNKTECNDNIWDDYFD